MNQVYISYKNFFSNESYDLSWYNFVDEAADYLLKFATFKDFLKRSDALLLTKFPIDEIKNELFQNLIVFGDQLLKLNEEDFLEEVSKRFNNVFFESFSNEIKVIKDPNAFVNHLPSIEIDSEPTIFDSETFSTIKELEKKLIEARKDFQTRFNQYLSSWPILPKSKIIKPPKIITFDTIDATFYKTLIEDTSLIKTLDWIIFEELLADILKTQGYNVELTKKTRDGGIDIIAIKRDDYFGFHKYLLQAKRYEKTVGIEPVRSIMFNLNHYNATKACIATTSNFSNTAIEMARKNYPWTLDLKDFNSIVKWLKSTYDIKKNSNH